MNDSGASRAKLRRKGKAMVGHVHAKFPAPGLT
jgi:hypothetical protein